MGQILLDEAPIWGIRLERRDDRLAVTPASKCPIELRELLVKHKNEILDLLQARSDNLKPDEAPWLHVARQVIENEFNGADASTREALVIGLRSISHPVCRRALAVLEDAQKGQRA